MIQLFNANGAMITVDEFGFEHYLEEGWGFTIPEKELPKKPVEKPSITKEEKLERAIKETKEALDAVEALGDTSEKATVNSKKASVPGSGVPKK